MGPKNIRFPADLAKQIQEEAKRDHRDFSDEVRRLCRLGLAEIHRGNGQGDGSGQANGLKEFMEAAK